MPDADSQLWGLRDISVHRRLPGIHQASGYTYRGGVERLHIRAGETLDEALVALLEAAREA